MSSIRRRRHTRIIAIFKISNCSISLTGRILQTIITFLLETTLAFFSAVITWSTLFEARIYVIRCTFNIKEFPKCIKFCLIIPRNRSTVLVSLQSLIRRSPSATFLTTLTLIAILACWRWLYKTKTLNPVCNFLTVLKEYILRNISIDRCAILFSHSCRKVWEWPFGAAIIIS